MKKDKVFIEGYVVGSFADTLGTQGKQIHIASGDIVDIDDNFIYKSIEPEKVKVPQFVADWIEEARKTCKEVGKWFIQEQPFDLVARAWLDGYEVEEEKRYRISMPKTRNYKNNAQLLCEKDGKIFWCGEWHPFRTKFTRKQLEEAGFGWLFSCEGVEIEEVE